MYTILIASVPIHGHVTPLLALTSGLTERGHRVRFLTGARFEPAVRAAGADFLALPAEADYDDRLLVQQVDGSRPGGLAGLRHDVRQGFLAPARAQYEALMAYSGAATDAVIVDPAFLGALLLTGHPRSMRPPVLLGGVLPLGLSSAHVPPFGLGLRPLSGPLGRGGPDRLRNAVLRFIVEHAVFGPVQRDLDELFRSVHGRPADAFVLNWMSTVDAIVQLTVPAFEYPRPDATVPIHFVGPPAPASNGALPAWWPELDASRPIVLVTQGTLTNADLGDLIRPALEALAEEDVWVIATTGGRPVEDLRTLPPNARAAEYLPYEKVFPFLDVLITNGGYGSVNYALRNRVPVVVAGASEDKPEVAARVAWSGAGLNLRTGRPTPKAIRRAVRRVLGSARYRESAAVAADQILGSTGVDGLINAIAALPKSGTSVAIPNGNRTA